MKTTALLASLVLFTSSVASAQTADKGEKKDDKDKTDSTEKASTGGGTEEGTIAEKTNAPPELQKGDEGTMTDVKERDGKYYYFIGFNYRGTIVPQFLMNLFVDGGRTVYNSAVALQLDIRKDNFSIIPQLILAEHAMPSTMFLEKGKAARQGGNWTAVGADIKALYGGVDLLWSAKMAKNFDFEFGFGVGIGVIMGDIYNNWVYGGRDMSNGGPANGPLKTQVGGITYSFTPCRTNNDGPQPGTMDEQAGCRGVNHQNAKDPGKIGATYDPATGKVSGGYTEPGWTSGGSVPSIMPWLSLPILGLRIKPVKALVLRAQIGFSLTGIYFQLGGFYGLERPTK
jgi:hypothetical protein